MKKPIRVVARSSRDKKKAKLMEMMINDMYGNSFCEPHLRYWRVRNTMFNSYLDKLLEGGDTHMMKKKGMTKNQKLKLNKTASAKKKVKATKK